MPNLQSIKPTDPLLFLIGNKAAIQRLAGSSWTILIGAILVITAGIARNYDHLYFLTEWEWLYGPFAASIISSLIIFIIGCFGLLLDKKSKHPYLTFLGLYWMTAPCAWLYGIPVESFTDILTATKWNVAFLAIVSVWRVALMIRAIQVLTEEPLIKSTCRILFPAAAIMLIASFNKGMNIVGIMGGVRLSPSEAYLKNAIDFTIVISFFTTIITLLVSIGIKISKSHNTPKPLPWNPIDAPKKLIFGSLIILGIWSLALIPFQEKAKNNEALRSLIHSQKFDEAMNYMAARNQNDFLMTHHFPPGTQDSSRNLNVYYKPILQRLKPNHPEWLKTQIILSLKLQSSNFYNESTTQQIEEILTEKSENFSPTPFSRELWQEIKKVHNLPEPSQNKEP